MNFDLVLTNPPFQDSTSRGKTPHKLWIEFTKAAFDGWLVDGGLLCQVSPSSFRSPSSAILGLLREKRTWWIDFDIGHHFPDVASLFSHYCVENADDDGSTTRTVSDGVSADIRIGPKTFYLPNVLTDESLSIHRKVIFETPDKLPVERDYVTCHNVLIHRSNTMSKTKTDDHVYPVLHTNRQVWWSSIRQDFADELKVMWSRSGYTKPFYDEGVLGCTDMGYFVRVDDEASGRNLEHNLNSKLFRYIFATARWSGFGNEKVFDSLPRVPLHAALVDDEMYELFDLSPQEVKHVELKVG